jgi:putative glutamine amidotransferase
LVEKVDLDRDRTEIVLTREALRTGMPILGICRGVQILNTVLGGNLFQDIPTQISNALPHWPSKDQPVDGAAHLVHLEPHSRLASILGTSEVRVVSYHHQAAKDVPQSLEIVARSPDGVIEGLEHSTLPFCIGVQWHPEIPGQNLTSMAPLFVAFVEAAAEYRQGDRRSD